MISLLLKHGGNPNQFHPLTDKSVFDYFLDFMPEGCNAILDHFIMLNGSSFQGKNLNNVTFNAGASHLASSTPRKFKN